MLASGKYDCASACAPSRPWTKRSAPCSSRVICSSKSECITMAAAPASSRRLTVSRLSTIGEAPGMSG